MTKKTSKTTLHSLGALRPSQREITNPKAPRFLGKMTVRRDLVVKFVEQLRETGDDEVVCELAGWVNKDHNGRFLTVQLSSRYAKKEKMQNSLESFFDASFEEATVDEHRSDEGDDCQWIDETPED